MVKSKNSPFWNNLTTLLALSRFQLPGSQKCGQAEHCLQSYHSSRTELPATR